MRNYYAPLYPSTFYHVYNRTNNKELLFQNDDNRLFFLKKYKQYLADYVKTYAYCLLDNHFHFLIQVRSEEAINGSVINSPLDKRIKLHQEFIDSFSKKENTSAIPYEVIISSQFQRFFNSYSKAYNKLHGREGNLLNQRFKRLAVESDDYFTQLIYYIHANSKHHGIMEDFRQYPWSSYCSILSDKPTALERAEVLDWFGGKEGFINDHQHSFELTPIEKFIIED